MLATSSGKLSLPYSWEDTQYAVGCRFGAMADGVYRCEPTTTNTAFTSSYFSDSKCTAKLTLGETFSGAPTPAFVVGERAFFAVGARVTTTFYETAGSGCSRVDLSLGQYYALGASLDATFVSATMTTD